MKLSCLAAVCALLFTSACGDDDAPRPIDAARDGEGGPGDARPDMGPADARDGGDGDAADGDDADPYVAICGNGEQDEGEACDDYNVIDGDGCSADCLSDETCGNRTVDDAADEICDDGNTLNGDGCSADCRSDETCGNSITDLGADEVCDDGNMMGGDGCSADCRVGPVCGDGTQHAPEVCDDGNTMGSDGCSADCRSDETCGNGTVDPGEACDDGGTVGGDGCSSICAREACGNGLEEGSEACDDGNTAEGDGCDNDCTFSCSGDMDCSDADVCSGVETCGTDHVCVDATDLPDGMSCGTDLACRGGSCVSTACGNGMMDGSEQCDDGNPTDGDGCDNDCTYSCAGDTDCDDGNVCNGAETCATMTHACADGTPPAAGTLCDRDAMPATRDICRRETCVASICGDGFLDRGVEACDDGNRMPGDGCENDCSITGLDVTAFRMTSVSFADPHFFTNVIICADITGSVNRQFTDALTTYQLNYVLVFRPLDLTMSTNPLDFVQGECMDTMPLDTCMVGASGMATPTVGTNMAAGATCLMADPTVLDSGYMVPPNTVGGPCFASSEETLSIDLGGTFLPMQHARVAATYSGGVPPNRLVSGLMMGFVTTADAKATTLPRDTPVVGGRTVYSLLADGSRGRGMTGGSCSPNDDRDTYMGVEGFWFHVNFTAEEVSWSGP